MPKHPAIRGYDRIAVCFDRERKPKIWEYPYFERLAGTLPRTATLLDCGCGSGHPALSSIIDTGINVTAMDGSEAMLRLFQKRYPSIVRIHCDMLGFQPNQTFEAIIAWDSFFHLTHEEQKRMLGRFARWLRPGGLLLFTSGPDHSSVSGEMFGTCFSYASFSDREYRQLLQNNGLTVRLSEFDEPGAEIHKVWLAEKVQDLPQVGA